jgi:NAD(P)-dependent dehydrogenase (short-subunit alcohol dehydrogenase family)
MQPKEVEVGFGRRMRAAAREFMAPRGVPVRYWEPRQAPGPSGLLSGQQALVVGGGGDIGTSIIREMTRQGAVVTFTEIDNDACAKAESALRTSGVEATGLVSSIADPDAIDSLVATTALPDVVVVNAASRIGALGLDASDISGWRRTFDTNVIGPFRLVERVARALIDSDRAGAIVFVTSGHDETVSRWPDYSASKAAIAMLVKELAVELGPHGIRVNGVAPGAVGVDKEGIPRRFRYAPLYGTAVAPEYIGRAVVFLASDYFSHSTTGVVVAVDSGLSLYSHRVAQEPPQ